MTALDSSRQAKMQWRTRYLPCPCCPQYTMRRLSITSKNDQIHSLPITHKEITHATRVNPILSQVLGYIKQGWLQHVDDLRRQPYFNGAVLNSLVNKIVYYGGYL